MKPKKNTGFPQFESNQSWQGEWAQIIKDRLLGLFMEKIVTCTETTEGRTIVFHISNNGRSFLFW